VVDVIRTVKPDVVLTFDPIGGYKHPDHIYMHEVTKSAFFAAGKKETESDLPPFQPRKLYYHTISKKYLRTVVRVLRLLGKDPSRWGRNEDIDLTEIARQDFPIHARIDYREVEDRKRAASNCHASQGSSGIFRKVFNFVFRLLGYRDQDLFIRAYPEPEGEKIEIEKDLFSGVK